MVKYKEIFIIYAKGKTEEELRQSPNVQRPFIIKY